MPGRQSTFPAMTARQSRAPRVPVLVVLPVVLALPALLRQAPAAVDSAFAGSRAPHDPARAPTARHAWKRPNLNLSPGPAPAATPTATRPMAATPLAKRSKLQTLTDKTLSVLEALTSKLSGQSASKEREQTLQEQVQQLQQQVREKDAELDEAHAALEDLYTRMKTLQESLGNLPGAAAAVASAAPPAPPAPVARPPSPPARPPAAAARPSAYQAGAAARPSAYQAAAAARPPVPSAAAARPPVPSAAAARPPAAAAAPAAVSGKTVAAEYMVSDAMIDEFYQKTVSGSGGLPPKGIIMDLVIKHFLGTFDAKTKSFTRTSNYKGPPPQLPGKRDLPPAMDMLKEQMKSPAFVTKGGPALDELEKVENDGKGWVWLAADMTPGGLALSLYTAVPYGKRPLLVAKQSQVDAMFDKVNWDLVSERFEKTMGGPHIKQR